jgi:hypothetical protein
MQRVARIHEIRRFARVVVRQETPFDDLEPRRSHGGLLSQQPEHDRRGVDGDDPCEGLGRGQSKLTGARAEVDHSGATTKPQRLQQTHLTGRVRVFLLVIARHMHRVEILAADAVHLVEQPTSVAA